MPSTKPIMPTASSVIERNQVKFESHGTQIVGHFYVPGGSGLLKLPAVVVAPPWLNVKEQVATNYARALAERGLAALAFDFRHWGESGGETRELESPNEKVEDVRAAVAFLQRRPEVSADRIGVLGICFGAGYVVKAATEDAQIHSVATVAAWLHDSPSLDATFGKEEIVRRRKAARDAEERFHKDKTVVHVPAASATDKESAMFGLDYYLNPARGPVKQWTNRMAVMSWPLWLDFAAGAYASRLKTPLLMVHSDGSALPNNVRRFYADAAGPKDLLWTEGNHTDFYDKPANVEKAADAVAAHFHRTLPRYPGSHR